MGTSIARMVMLALAGQSLLSMPAGSIHNAGKPRRLKRVLNDTYDWFGPKGSTGNKYKPHQGKQEIARRLRGKPVSKPRRMWTVYTYSDLFEICEKFSCRKEAALYFDANFAFDPFLEMELLP